MGIQEVAMVAIMLLLVYIMFEATRRSTKEMTK